MLLGSKDLVVGVAAGAALAYAATKLLAVLKAKRTAAITDTPIFYYWPARGRGEQIVCRAEAGVSSEQPSFVFGDQDAMKKYFEDCRCKGGNLTTNVPMLYIDGLYLTRLRPQVRCAQVWHVSGRSGRGMRWTT